MDRYVYVLFYEQYDPMNHSQYNPEHTMIGIYETEAKAEQEIAKELPQDRHNYFIVKELIK